MKKLLLAIGVSLSIVLSSHACVEAVKWYDEIESHMRKNKKTYIYLNSVLTSTYGSSSHYIIVKKLLPREYQRDFLLKFYGRKNKYRVVSSCNITTIL